MALSDEKLRWLAQQTFVGQVFCSDTLPELDFGLLARIFLPLAFMRREELDALHRRDVVHLYGEMQHAVRTFRWNGYPVASAPPVLGLPMLAGFG
jgi:hypothetical protein